MNRWLRPVASSAALHGWLLILRIAIASVMLNQHGIPKLLKIIDGNWQFADPLGLGSELSLGLVTFAEVGCSLLLLIGFLTRWAALPLLFTMLVVLFIVNAGNPFGEKEVPLLFALIYATLFFTGAGKYSVDGRRNDL